MLSKKKQMRLLAVMLIPAVAFILSAFAPEVWAQDEELEAKFIFETNFTDGDTGIQFFTDGEPWKEIKIWDPDGKLILDVKAKGNLKGFGLTELFGESNEPTWRELDPDYTLEDIVELFPEDEYTFVAKLVEGGTLEGEATLSHDLPCAPTNLEPEEASTVANGSTVTISWDSVTKKLDIENEICSADAADTIDIAAYQVIVENITSDKEFSIFVDASETEVTVPEQFLTDDSDYKYEVLAIADLDGEGEYGNQTIAETWFCSGAVASGPNPIACPDPD